MACTMCGTGNERPKFLPSLKEWGVAKLPDRQKVRDVINAIANPPVGSEDFFKV